MHRLNHLKQVPSPILLFAVLLARPCPGSVGWSELRGEGFLVRFRDADRALAGVLLADLTAWRTEVVRKLGEAPGDPVTVYLASSEGEFRELTGGRVPHWGGGCAFPSEGLIVLKKLPGQSDVLLRTARHEISHLVLHRIVSGRVPVWFDEGVAMWTAQEWRLRESFEIIHVVLFGGLIPLGEIDEVLGFSSPKAHLAYTESLLAVTYLIRLGGSDAVGRVVEELSAGAAFDVALYRVTGYTPRRFEETWSDYVRGRFSAAALMMTPEALWFYLALLFLVAYLCVRLRNRGVVRRWDEEDPEKALPDRLRLKVHRRRERP